MGARHRMMLSGDAIGKIVQSLLSCGLPLCGEATAIASGELRMLRLWRCNIRALHAKWIKNVLLDVRGVVLARNHLNNIPRQCQAKIRVGPSCLWG